jgi:hypothetical protein
MNLADKINQLSLIKTRFSGQGEHTAHTIEQFKSEHDLIEHYRKLFRHSDNFDKLIDLNLQIQNLLLQYSDTSKYVKQQINEVIHIKERGILQYDYNRYNTQVVDQTTLDIRNNNISSEFVELVCGVIYKISDWRFAGCVIDPIDAQFVVNMVGSEPLYIVSKNDVCVKRVRKKLNDFYVKQRLRIYNRIKDLPQHLGLTVCVNQFEYMPLDDQGDVLQQVYKHTLPGGQMIVTFNDCDQRASLEHTLEGLRFYSTKELTLGKAFSIGWDVVKTETTNNGVWNYAILQKPGQLHSIKTSAPMVENIKAK